ncbi:MAG TPA: ArsA family ATPase [Mycobacteriales bacterium]|nr:ArsA family ATPase [Mycobacteriales bacterium]
MAQFLLFTGKGGVGTTTVAAATAALLARRGQKTLLLSTEPTRSLGDTLGEPLGPQAREIDGGLAALSIDPQRRLQASWQTVLDYLGGPGPAAVSSVATEETTVLPGAADVLALLELRDLTAGGKWDTVVVDGPSAAATVALLALPETLTWYVRRAFPIERRIARAMRPGGGAGGPADRLLDAATRLAAELAEIRTVLADPSRTQLRLVLTPEATVLADARRTVTALATHGHRVGGIVANKVIPAPTGPAPDPWRAGWAASQRRQLAELAGSFPGVPVRPASYRPAEPVGLRALHDLAREVYGTDDPATGPPPEPASTIDRDGAEYLLRLPLPFADRSDVDLARSGDELVLTVAGARRLLTLPSGLRRCITVGAVLRDGTLTVRFRPDPAQWPR